MHNVSEMDRLLPWADDYEKVIKELRCKENPQHRIDAANVLLNNFDDPERIKFLLNAILYDPDRLVQEAVRKITHVELGNELQLALKVEATDGEPCEQPWLVDCIMDASLRETQENQEIKSEIERLVHDKDVPALIDVLRNPFSVQKRIWAAKALGALMDIETAENLARAVIDDPDETVQQAALEALYRIIGEVNAELLLGEVMRHNYDEEWLLPTNEFEVDDSKTTQNDSPFGIRDSDVLHGLITLARGARDPKERIKTLSQLTKYSDIRINETFAEIALFDGDTSVREKAMELLNTRLGEDLTEFLDYIKNKAPYLEAMTDDEDSSDRSPGVPEILSQPPVSKNYDQVIKEEKPPYYLLIILGAAFIVFVVIFMTLK